MSGNHQVFDFENLRARLSKYGYKMTPQRKEILKIFIDHPDNRHMSTEDVHIFLREHHSDIGIATVYRTLELLSDLSILVQVDFGEGHARYELNTANAHHHHHHHLICLQCKKVIEFEEDLLDDLEKNIADTSEFQIVNHEVKFFGYCKDCQSAR